MKVLCLTPWFPEYAEDPCGSYVCASVQALKALGCESKVLLVKPWVPRPFKWIGRMHDKTTTAFQKNYDVETCHFFSVPRNYLKMLSHWAYQRRLVPIIKKLVAQYHCELIHVHTELYASAAVKVAKELGIPVVVTMHGFEKNKRYWRASGSLIRESLNAADRVVLVGEALASHFKTIVDKDDHVRIVYNGFRSIFGKSGPKNAWSNSLRFISVSNLTDEGKNIDIVLKALSELKSSGITNWTYVIVGDGVLRKPLEALVRFLRLQDKVQFVGACAHNKVCDYLSQADIFCLPSAPEAFGIAHLEAMAGGLLTIGAEGEGPQAFIKHGETGFLVQSRSVSSLLQVFHEIFKSQSQTQVIAKTGKIFALENFTWHHHAKQLYKIYQELL